MKKIHPCSASMTLFSMRRLGYTADGVVGLPLKSSQFDGVLFNDSGDDSEAVWYHNEGTIWDLIPDIKQSLNPHQQEGFEFIWTNLAGTTDLAKLKRVDLHSEGGCIISHAPGTGKTRLTMVFLQTYLQLFPKCLPIIIAPANILLAWEDASWEPVYKGSILQKNLPGLRDCVLVLMPDSLQQ